MLVGIKNIDSFCSGFRTTAFTEKIWFTFVEFPQITVFATRPLFHMYKCRLQ